jgi:hypothetical protein
MYANEMGESCQFQVADRAAELVAIADSCRAVSDTAPPPSDWKDPPPPAPPEYPKTMVHPGFPIGGATGLLMKDYRGKDANREIWKFDSALFGKPRWSALVTLNVEDLEFTEDGVCGRAARGDSRPVRRAVGHRTPRRLAPAAEQIAAMTLAANAAKC